MLGNRRDLQRLAAGRCEIPFSFRIPTGLPTSYYHKKSNVKGYIRYSLKATMLRPWNINLHATTVIQLKDIVMTNTPQLSTPLSAQCKRMRSCFCCGSGPITMLVETDKGGTVQENRLLLGLELRIMGIGG